MSVRSSPLNENQRWFLSELQKRQGLWNKGLPMRPSISAERMEEDVVALHEHGYVRVSGPPNGNADLGFDVDLVQLLRRTT